MALPTSPHATDGTAVTRADLPAAVIGRMTTRRFDRFVDVMAPDVAMLALLPAGGIQFPGVDAVIGAFDRWFGDVDEYDVVDVAGAWHGDRLQLHWTLDVCGGRFGDVRHHVQQDLYADLGPDGTIAQLSLLCSGFTPVAGHG